MARPSAQSLIGRRIGPYEVTAFLGAGGMGEVYRATDERLGREVAIKVLPAAFSQDSERLRRFEQEARTAGMLNHPHIVTVHDVGLIEGMPFIVSEMLEGETLRARFVRGRLAVGESTGFALQIAQGLAAVHEKGIVHRDLKPENLFVTRDGRVKILDFGLAKLKAGSVSILDGNAPTIQETEQGTLMGTVGYMSPEQVRGQDADHRSDIFSFGAVLYEMLTGNRAFHGSSNVEVLHAILKYDPSSVAEQERHYGSGLERIVRRCLEKEPQRRFQSANDLAFAIEMLSPANGDTPGAPTATRRREGRNRTAWFAWSAAILFAVAFTAMLVRLAFRTTAVAPEMRLEVTTLWGTDPTSIALSPDGRRLVFVSSANGKPQLSLRLLDSETTTLIAGTEGASYPFWSPDSLSVGFFAGNKLKRIDVRGGASQELCDAPSGRGGSWSPTGVIVFSRSTNSPLFRIPAIGGKPSPATTLGEGQTNHRSPSFLPDGRQFLFNSAGGAPGIYLGSLDSPEAKLVTATGSSAAYHASGWLMFLRSNALLAQRFDAARGILSGDPVKVADVDTGGPAAFSVSAEGTVAYSRGRPDRRQLAWFDRSGNLLGTVGAEDENDLMVPELSPDQHRVAVHRTTEKKRDVWLLEGGRTTKFTFDLGRSSYPVWSPDGASIAFSRAGGGANGQIIRKPSTPSGTEELLMESAKGNSDVPDDWSPDGGSILFFHQDVRTGNIDEWVLPLDGKTKPHPYLDKPFEERHGQFSPDGKSVAFTSDQSGRYEIYVASFPVPSKQWKISESGGIQPRWSHDGKEIYYLAPDGKLMAVPVALKGTDLDRGDPKVLFQTRIWGGGSSVANRRQYTVAKDGRFLINVTTQEAGAPITVLLNWKPPEK